jgi:hypothetical protein
VSERAAPTSLGWDAFLNESIRIEAASPSGADWPHEPLDALPERELPTDMAVPHDAPLAAVLMPEALDTAELLELASVPHCDDGARDLLCACSTWTDEFGHDVMQLWLVGAGNIVQRRDGDGNVRIRAQWRGREWPVLVAERNYEGAAAIARRLETVAPQLGDAVRAAVALAADRDAPRGMMAEVMAMAWSVMMRARLGTRPGMRCPEHQALTRRMWARCIGTVRARAEAQVAEDALPVPSVAGQLSMLHVVGRTAEVVGRVMQHSHRFRPSMRVTADGREVVQHVEVMPYLPDGVTDARVAAVLAVEPTLFPNIGPETDVQALMMDVLVQRLSARNLMRTLCYIALIHERCGVELEGDELPAALRKDVMKVTGYPSHTASDAQRNAYRDIAGMVRRYQWLVVPHSTGGGSGKGKATRRATRVPLLLASQLEVPTDAPTRMVVNPDVLEGGRTMPVPRALMEVRDEDDPDGALRMSGVGIVSRLALSGKDHHRLHRGESLLTALARWRLADTLERLHRKDGAVRAQRWLDGLLDRLRCIGPANIIGDTHVEWGKGRAWLAEATLHYGAEQPGWLRKRPLALPPADGRGTPLRA